MDFNKELFVQKIREKMFADISEQKKRLPDSYFADQIGISKATFSRVMNFKAPDLDTAARICQWLGSKVDDFIKAA